MQAIESHVVSFTFAFSSDVRTTAGKRYTILVNVVDTTVLNSIYQPVHNIVQIKQPQKAVDSPLAHAVTHVNPVSCM